MNTGFGLRSDGVHFPRVSERVYVDPAAVVIGEVALGDDVSIWPMAVVRGDVSPITIGASSNIQDGAVLHVTHDGPFSPGGRGLEIGEGVTVGHKALLHACTIGSWCLIGMNAVLMDDVVVEDEVLVGAGSLVTPGSRLLSGYLYRGAPAVQARPLTDREREHLRYSAANYVRLKDRYLGIED